MYMRATHQLKRPYRRKIKAVRNVDIDFCKSSFPAYPMIAICLYKTSCNKRGPATSEPSVILQTPAVAHSCLRSIRQQTGVIRQQRQTRRVSRTTAYSHLAALFIASVMSELLSPLVAAKLAMKSLPSSCLCSKRDKRIIVYRYII